MRHLPFLLLIALILAITGCSRGGSINGHTTRTAYRSVKTIKQRLPPDNRVEFEVSFWTIRDAHKSDEEFLDVVDGKSPFDIIDMAKEIYQQRKASGFKPYEKYNSWDEMIAKFDKERIDQDKGNVKTERNYDSPNGSVIYNLRARQH
jgi:hypothetical protein